MYCKNCGKEIIDETNFCSHCGIQNKSPSRKEKNPETDKKSSSFNQIIKIFGIVIVFIIAIPILISIISAFIYGFSTGSDGPTSSYAKNYNEGVNNYNEGISFFNKGVTNIKNEEITAAIAKFEISEDFFSKAKINYEVAMRESDTDSDMYNNAKYMMQSSDYFYKGLDEYMNALRLLEKYKGTNLLTVGMGALLNPELVTSITSELSEIKIKSEKAKNYFDLANNARESAERYK